MDVYVYYRVRTGFSKSLAQQVREMQADLSQRFHIQPALKQRQLTSEEAATWMEVYAEVPSDFLAALEQAAIRLEGIDGARHIEIFTEIESI
jgi:hypothetical protein